MHTIVQKGGATFFSSDEHTQLYYLITDTTVSRTVAVSSVGQVGG